MCSIVKSTKQFIKIAHPETKEIDLDEDDAPDIIDTIPNSE
jgi:hypothetical protein